MRSGKSVYTSSVYLYDYPNSSIEIERISGLSGANLGLRALSHTAIFPYPAVDRAIDWGIVVSTVNPAKC